MEKCPNGCNLQGELIPEKDRHHFGDATHFSRTICVELPFYDGGLIILVQTVKLTGIDMKSAHIFVSL